MRLVKEKFGLEQITKGLIGLGLFAAAVCSTLAWRDSGRIRDYEIANRSAPQSLVEKRDLYAFGATLGLVAFGAGVAGYGLYGRRKE